MQRVFLDANVLFSAAYASGAGLQRLWKLTDVQLLTSAYALDEARRNLSRPSQRGRLTRLMRMVEVVPDPTEVQLPAEVELPAKDQPILAAALGAKATHLVTGDVKHFGLYYGKLLQGIVVLAPAAFLKIMDESLEM